jgi:HSP20 family protein
MAALRGAALRGGLSGMSRILEESPPGGARLWAPPVDVAESEIEIVLYAELPGMSREEIDIQLSGDTLTLRGERKFVQAAQGEHFHRIERQYGPWRRAFQIEVPIDAARVTASYVDGLLTVRLPKQEEIKPRQIQIEVR